MNPGHRLIVMRHAKAGELPGGPDAERALRPRGCRDASAAGRWLAGRGLVPDLVLCSSARRARQTWQYVSSELPGEPEVISDPRLYEAAAGRLLGILGETPDGVGSLMYVGHNPAAADLTEQLLGRAVEMPTAATVIMDVPVGWSELAAGAACGACELVASWAPRADAG